MKPLDQKIFDPNRSGFGSLSRFNDAFKRACGCTARQHRKRHQGA
jgi:AraC-like DNA-binding protein